MPLGSWLHFLGVPESYGLTIHAYALCILVGIVLAVVVTSRRLTKRGAEPGVVLDIALWTVPLGIIGARLFHVVTHPGDYFGTTEKLVSILYIWEGGLAIFGALIGGAIGVLIGCRITGIRFWAFADAMAPGLILAQAFGRLGNWFNHELFGWPTSAPWGLQIESSNPAFPVGLPADTLFQPTFLYEIIWNTLGFLVILFFARRLQWGKQLAVYLIWYGAGRMVWETIRVDPSLYFLGIRTNVWAALVAVVLGIVILVVQSRRHPGAEPSVYRPGREWAGPTGSAVDSAETYSDTDDDGDDATATPENPTATSGADKRGAESTEVTASTPAGP
ncbi:prolipoprotein diacylglyceryl transferase [Galbitalea sp. SE-J8]|uniref:prolipoprotein diacylglyceryl transferase n=1 Tax=Galbitalea sp. SE-J8 TaxID=3054952 RepID=UPI00259CDB30|nr:prolipoprotein diacylglyceryl transferase [Galbitalea sp. SE-J8]MDM4764052.1 prolipoprotein diacylglyceryl transferase [Galbitalea sp. SE-J8]